MSKSGSQPPAIPKNYRDWILGMDNADIDRMIWRQCILAERKERRKKRITAIFDKKSRVRWWAE